ncbi:MAG TPA: hypothetical protein VFU22_28970 [Roseiflexaceae bacterium]|nr:hypothetical protein [Roseiflexaceae bacterium]
MLRNLPFPLGTWPRAARRSAVEAIAAATRDLVTVRDAWLAGAAYPELPIEKRTLTNLYNARPAWLDEARRQLDLAVLDAYGWSHDLSDEEIGQAAGAESGASGRAGHGCGGAR